MRIDQLSDSDLLTQIKQLTTSEREVTTKILHHLREVEKRRLFSDLGYSSLFDYAVKELKYCEGQAGRRIRAMRLINELPEVGEKLANGELSLSNVAQAHSFFRELAKTKPEEVTRTQKLHIMSSLQNKSTREAQRTLIALQPNAALPKEKERVIAPTKTEVSFVMDDDLKAQLEEVRALAGPDAASMSYGELFKLMARLSLISLKAKKFGKKRSTQVSTPSVAPIIKPKEMAPTSARKLRDRYIPKSIRHSIWVREVGKCQQCAGKRNLQVDHIKPFALGGTSDVENLRLLCFQCNQRAGIKVFGLCRMRWN